MREQEKQRETLREAEKHVFIFQFTEAGVKYQADAIRVLIND